MYIYIVSEIRISMFNLIQLINANQTDNPDEFAVCIHFR